MYAKHRESNAVGLANPKTRLTPTIVLEIRRVYREEKPRQVDLAEMFGVPQTAISSVVRRKNWKHI